MSWERAEIKYSFSLVKHPNSGSIRTFASRLAVRAGNLGGMLTREELRAKAEATRLKNLLAKKAAERPLTQLEQRALKRLQARAQAMQKQARAR